MKAMSTGLIQRWMEMTRPRPKWCDISDDAASPFSLSDVVSVFVVLVIGLATSSIAFTIEMTVLCIGKYKSKTLKQEHVN